MHTAVAAFVPLVKERLNSHVEIPQNDMLLLQEVSVPVAQAVVMVCPDVNMSRNIRQQQDSRAMQHVNQTERSVLEGMDTCSYAGGPLKCWR